MSTNFTTNSIFEIDELIPYGFLSANLNKVDSFFKENNLTLMKKYTLIYQGDEVEEIIEKFFNLGEVLNETDRYGVYKNIYIVLSFEHQSAFRLLIENSINFTAIKTDVYFNKNNRKLDYETILNQVLGLNKDKLIARYKMFSFLKNEKSEFDFNEVLYPNIVKEAYPFVDNLEDFIQHYLKSNATILFFYGEPGTGKTNLIKKIIYESIKKTKKNEIFYAPEKSSAIAASIYFDYLKDVNSNILVLEDLDNFLYSREEGNDFMSILLNISDGLIKSQHKKIIITSNLGNLNNSRIDAALLRKGRCFASVKFRKLTLEESYSFLKAQNITVELDKEAYSLAELYDLIND